ncbi:glycosyltransferase involved in cell wall biosynthesis [Clostridium acetobutylicum]|uniref:Glycosyltransferase n=1 Tax=Clostridium acetobutylicum (strain ATCC 824 / DSM 792 / JCM 1419 / IAM 19013 / LMG 5710 / NBRC 13948 / NRRL B-527 / VKM B-1787 / 2291 / W) TaxID=272562 RepID=Q97EP0_CLOAB|nr:MULTISPECIES: glycosyltransferase [Clostridium]AAK81008.1 Glycosyltransferase [Clostridium acetobutylicum ATCC 824]ADZ22111.1 Glycosyltransferase [Clostridium acetobutylicum EA 2018]AEI32673.1 glycosyltransferase [Clostridium acetobutylicum DSM 1731]AWV78581.1 glycosyltransferase [Clostridium acetobutylicum]MBC2393441.1 glycosyltransferase [Clostridium acetobutylicum]
MKVCMISGALPPIKCGVGDYSDILCSHLNKNSNIDLSVITSYDANKSYDYKIYNEIKSWNITELGRVLKLIKGISPDIVHIQYPTVSYKKGMMINILPYFLHKKYKVITTLHEYTDSSILGKIRTNVGVLPSDLVIVVDDRYKKDLEKKKLFNKVRIEKINIGSNIPKSQKTYGEILSLKNKLLFHDKKKIIGYFGFVNNKKGIENILLAVKCLKDSGYKDVQFNIMAELDASNAYHNKILKMIIDLGLNKDVLITGYLRKQVVGDYVKACDVMVLPFLDGLSSKNGSFICALQEKRSIITTKPQIDNVYNKYKDERYVYFVDRVNNYKEIYNGLIDLLFQNKFSTVGNNLNDFSWESIADEHYKVYKLLEN